MFVSTVLIPTGLCVWQTIICSYKTYLASLKPSASTFEYLLSSASFTCPNNLPIPCPDLSCNHPKTTPSTHRLSNPVWLSLCLRTPLTRTPLCSPPPTPPASRPSASSCWTVSTTSSPATSSGCVCPRSWPTRSYLHTFPASCSRTCPRRSECRSLRSPSKEVSTEVHV